MGSSSKENSYKLLQCTGRFGGGDGTEMGMGDGVAVLVMVAG